MPAHTPQRPDDATTVAAPARPEPATADPPPGGGHEPPRLADGLELIGEFEDSGFKEAPYIARRADGQVVQLPPMLYRLAEQVDGQRGFDEIAEGFSTAIERRVEPGDVRMLIDEQLRPLGVVAPAGGEQVELGKVDPLLALKFRAAVVPDRAVRALTTVFRPLFLPPIVLVVVLGMLGLDGWLFFVHGVSQSLRHTLYQPLLMLMLIGGVVLATAWHEIGHATACRYGGAEPGVMGVGIYIVWPAFYTDITDAYRLGKWGRLRTDVGGMYFNAIFALVAAGVYALTSFEPLLLLVVLQNFAILQQSLPFLRLDGYYILSDLTGVPDIFLRIRSVLASLIPGRPADERVTELLGWVRAVVTGYVVLIVLFFAVTILALVLNLPRMVATGYDSAALRYQAIGPAFDGGRTLAGLLDAVQLVFLILPGAGLAYTAARVGGRSTVGAMRWAGGSPARQGALALAGTGGLALAAFSWWPNGEYRPVQPGERGTLTGVVQEVAALPTARPSLTPARQRQLRGAPTERQRQAAQPSTARRLVTPNPTVTSTTDTTPTDTTQTTTVTTPAPDAQATTTVTTPTTTTPASTTPTTTPAP
jgi:putative peptide zinc metalloprotease protein